MKNDVTRRSLLRRYLLGQLPADKAASVTTRLRRSAHARLELSVAEDELIEAYAAQELSPADKQIFEHFFLRSGERRAQLQVEQLLPTRLTSGDDRISFASFRPLQGPTARQRWRVGWLLFVFFLLLVALGIAWLAQTR